MHLSPLTFDYKGDWKPLWSKKLAFPIHIHGKSGSHLTTFLVEKSQEHCHGLPACDMDAWLT